MGTEEEISVKELLKELKVQSDDLKTVKEELKDLRTLKDKLNNRDTHIMFSVYSNSGYNLESGSYIDFDYSWVENGYPLTNGEFIAPVRGNYEFSITGHTYRKTPGPGTGPTCSSGRANIEVLRDGVQIHQIEANDSDDENNFFSSNNLSSSWIITLNAGNSIRLYVSAGCIFTDSYFYRTFTGKLIEVL